MYQKPFIVREKDMDVERNERHRGYNKDNDDGDDDDDSRISATPSSSIIHLVKIERVIIKKYHHCNSNIKTNKELTS